MYTSGGEDNFGNERGTDVETGQRGSTEEHQEKRSRGVCKMSFVSDVCVCIYISYTSILIHMMCVHHRRHRNYCPPLAWLSALGEGDGHVMRMPISPP